MHVSTTPLVNFRPTPLLSDVMKQFAGLKSVFSNPRLKDFTLAKLVVGLCENLFSDEFGEKDLC